MKKISTLRNSLRSTGSTGTKPSSTTSSLTKTDKPAPLRRRERNGNSGGNKPTTENNGNSTIDRANTFATSDINFDTPESEPEVQSLVTPESVETESTTEEAPSTTTNDYSNVAEDTAHIPENAEVEQTNETPETEEATEAAGAEEVAETEETGEAEGEEQFVVGADDPDNPYDGHNATAVEVTPWDGTDGSPNDHIEGILRNQGYSVEEIYAPNENGQNLVDQVAEVNEIEDPNVINSGQELVVPTTAEATPVEEEVVVTPEEASPPQEDVIVYEADPFADGDFKAVQGSDDGETIRTTGTDGDDAINVVAGGGDDTVEISTGQGDDLIDVAAGDGTDTVAVDAGAGDDTIRISAPSEDSYVVNQTSPVRTTDSITVDGGAGEDTAVLLSENGHSYQTRFDEETGQTSIYASNGTRVDFNDVEQVNVQDSEGEITEFILNDSGELVEVEAVAEVPETETDVAPEAEAEPLSDTEAVDVLLDNYSWVADSENGDADIHSGARFDEGVADLASDDWSGRENFVDNLTQSVNPDAEVEGTFYSQDEAEAAADELQEAASVLSDNETLVNIIDGRNDSDTNAQDQKFDFVDLFNGSYLYSERNQEHIDTVSAQSGALQTLQDVAYNDTETGELRRDVFQDIAKLENNEDYASWAAGDIDFDEFLDRNEDGAEIVDILLENIDVPEGTTEVSALNDLIGASVFLAEGFNFDTVSAANGTHDEVENNRRVVDESLNIEDDIHAVADLV